MWFQNRRAKEKRLKKDAGRQRWSPYFRNLKDRGGNDNDDHNSLLDEHGGINMHESFASEF